MFNVVKISLSASSTYLKEHNNNNSQNNFYDYLF